MHAQTAHRQSVGHVSPRQRRTLIKTRFVARTEMCVTCARYQWSETAPCGHGRCLEMGGHVTRDRSWCAHYQYLIPVRLAS